MVGVHIATRKEWLHCNKCEIKRVAAKPNFYKSPLVSVPQYRYINSQRSPLNFNLFLDIFADFAGILAGILFINFFKDLYPKY